MLENDEKVCRAKKRKTEKGEERGISLVRDKNEGAYQGGEGKTRTHL